MGKMLTNAACLIRTRMFKVGFPMLFSHLPEDMTKACAERIGRYTDAAMQYVSELSGETEKVRKVVIREDKFLILGIAGALNDILPEKASEYNGLLDGYRKIPCFVGLVWNLMEGSEFPTAFPEYESFTKVLKNEILTHWTENDTSKWSERFAQGMAMPYQEQAMIPDKTAQKFDGLNLLLGKQCVAPVSDSDAMLQAALDAVIEGKSASVSACTEASLSYAQQPFMNVTTTEVQTVQTYPHDIKKKAESKPNPGQGNVAENGRKPRRNGGSCQSQGAGDAQSEDRFEYTLMLMVDETQLRALMEYIRTNRIEVVFGEGKAKNKSLWDYVRHIVRALLDLLNQGKDDRT